MSTETLTKTSIEISLLDHTTGKYVRDLRPAPIIQTKFESNQAWLDYIEAVKSRTSTTGSRNVTIFENGRIREELSDGSLVFYSRNADGNIDGMLKHYENYGGFIANGRSDLPKGRFDIGDHAFEEFNDVVEKRFFLRQKIFYKDGLRQGVYKEYTYEDGFLCELSERSFYRQGKLHGLRYLFDSETEVDVEFYIKGSPVTKGQWERYKAGPNPNKFQSRSKEVKAEKN